MDHVTVMDLKQCFTKTSALVYFCFNQVATVSVCPRRSTCSNVRYAYTSVFERELLLFKHSTQNRVISGYRSSVRE
jgi:hypothetical protein